MKNIVIITGGNLDTGFAATYISEQIEKNSNNQEKPYYIVADHGVDHCRSLDIIPDEIYGDFDSAKADGLAFYEDKEVIIHRFPVEKDESDTELTMIRALEMAEESDLITILGGTGTRIDHVLGNIHMLKFALDKGVNCHIVDSHNRIRLIKQGITLQKDEQFGDYVSLIPFSAAVNGITLKGFAYNVEDFALQMGISRGLSNQIISETASISLNKGLLLVIESRD